MEIVTHGKIVCTEKGEGSYKRVTNNVFLLIFIDV